MVILIVLIVSGLALAFSIVDGRKMIDCKACGQKMAKSARHCPHCGAASTNKIIGDIATGTIGGCCLAPFILIFIIIIAVFFTFNKSTDKEGPDITLAEFNQIQYGMTYAQCSNIIDGKGEVISETTIDNITTTTIFWEGNNGEYSGANITFQNGVVYSMIQNNLK